MRKILIITSCSVCQHEGWGFTKDLGCTLAKREFESNDGEIPKWCPLPDADSDEQKKGEPFGSP